MNDLLSLPSSANADNRIDGQIASLKAMSLDGKKTMTDKQMREVAGQFEELMVRQILKEMRKSIPKDGFIEQSHATEMYTEMVDDHLAKQLGDTGCLGVGEMIYDELKEKYKDSSNPEDVDVKSEFKSLKNDAASPAESKFMPLAPDTETFMKLQNKNQMMDLPQKSDPFMSLDRRHNVPTDRIENK